MRSAWARIDLGGLRHNMARVKQLAPHSRILGIVKANAYGHGLVEIARALTEHDSVAALGLARINEALRLRQAGISCPMVLLEGFFDAHELPLLAASQLQPVIHTEQQLQMLEGASGLSAPLKVWLKVDSGMHRLGIAPQQLAAFQQRLRACGNVAGEPILMSHMACADEREHAQNTHQQAVIASIRALTPPSSLASFANSATLIQFPELQADWVRPGLMLYGASPVAKKNATELDLKPVMTLCASVIATRDIKAGEAVGYGAHWVSEQATRLGVVAIGYGDGYPRHARTGTPVLINGKRYPIVGRVSMDMLTVDLGDDDIEAGATAVLWGVDRGLDTSRHETSEHSDSRAVLHVEEVAAFADTIAYELLCNIAQRVDYEYVE